MPPLRTMSQDALQRLIGEEYGIRTYADFCQIFASWAYGRLTDPEAGAERLKRRIATLNAGSRKVGLAPGCFTGSLPSQAGQMSRPDCALEQIDEALEIADSVLRAIAESSTSIACEAISF